MISREAWYKEAEDPERTYEELRRGSYDALIPMAHDMYRNGFYGELYDFAWLLVEAYESNARTLLADHKIAEMLSSLRNQMEEITLEYNLYTWPHGDNPEGYKDDSDEAKQKFLEFDWDVVLGKVIRILPHIEYLDQLRKKYVKDALDIFQWMKAKRLL